ncbi:MAG: hypothetical protein ABI230_03910 [Aestuariivirga sp.]
MKFSPTIEFKIHSSLSPDMAVAALTQNVEPSRKIRIGNSNKYFEGYVAANQFEIERIIPKWFGVLPTRNNADSPLIKGTITSEGSGTSVIVVMYLRATFFLPAVLLSLVPWIALAYAFLFGADAQLHQNLVQGFAVCAIWQIWMMVWFALLYAGFRHYAGLHQKKLEEILQVTDS